VKYSSCCGGGGNVGIDWALTDLVISKLVLEAAIVRIKTKTKPLLRQLIIIHAFSFR
jgi:hypothetical protein